MSGFFSWITGLLGRPKAATPKAAEPRLFNPPDSDDEGWSNSQLAIQLEEHLFSWLMDAEPHKLNADFKDADPRLEELERRLHSRDMKELPRQPGSLPQLLQALSSGTIERRQVTNIILSDPALTDQLLQIANSPFFRRGDHHIESVDQAVFVLGIDGIRSVTAAAVIRPMMAARNSREALFAQRAWRWGLTCARATEMVAKCHGDDTSAHFVVGLMPALAYLTIRRELARIGRNSSAGPDPDPALLRLALARQQWPVCQLLANAWNLPPKYHAWLLIAERPAPRQSHSALTDGLLLGTREVLRHSRQRNLPEDELFQLINLPPEKTEHISKTLAALLEEGRASTTRVK